MSNSLRKIKRHGSPAPKSIVFPLGFGHGYTTMHFRTRDDFMNNNGQVVDTTCEVVESEADSKLIEAPKEAK